MNYKPTSLFALVLGACVDGHAVENDYDALIGALEALFTL